MSPAARLAAATACVLLNESLTIAADAVNAWSAMTGDPSDTQELGGDGNGAR